MPSALVTEQYDTAAMERKADELMEEMHSAIYDKLCPNGDRVQGHLFVPIDPVVAWEAIIGARDTLDLP